jgi:hypothetical protein
MNQKAIGESLVSSFDMSELENQKDDGRKLTALV